MSDILAEICKKKKEHIAQKKREKPFSQIEASAKKAASPRGFYKALLKKAEKKQTALIAEIKKASPSKGIIRKDFDVTAIAKAYDAGGAACLSVLTDEPYFSGKDEYIAVAQAAVGLPVLRKDFMLDPYQITESRALGADCILLIMAALSDGQAKELEVAATSLGMDVLVEVHDEKELERALKLKSPLLGVNNRNLKTMETSLEVSRRLRPLVPKGRLTICESGIFSRKEVLDMQGIGMGGFLVGESLMKSADITAATRSLLGF